VSLREGYGDSLSPSRYSVQLGMRMKNTARPRGNLKCTRLIARNCFPDFLPAGALNRDLVRN